MDAAQKQPWPMFIELLDTCSALIPVEAPRTSVNFVFDTVPVNRMALDEPLHIRHRICFSPGSATPFNPLEVVAFSQFKQACFSQT